MSFDPACLRKAANWSSLSQKHKFEKPTFDVRQVIEDLPKMSPKLKTLLDNIQELDAKDMAEHGKLFKHFIFSEVKQGGYGVKIITSGMLASGYNLAYDRKLKLYMDKDLLNTINHNFVLLCSTDVYGNLLTSRKKKELLDKYNQRPDNSQGELIRFILLDSGFKEGIDLFDVKYVHIFEPQTSKADLKQAIGRATRLCGQKGLDFHPTRGWPLSVYLYDVSIPSSIKYDSDTLYKLYLKNTGINLQLMDFVDELEKYSIIASVDYELTKNVHNFKLEDDEYIFPLFQNGGKDAIFCNRESTCGKIRPTKTMPVSIPLFLTVMAAQGKMFPVLKANERVRGYFCNLLKTDKSFCSEVKKAWEDPVDYVQTNYDKIKESIDNSYYENLPSFNKKTFKYFINKSQNAQRVKKTTAMKVLPTLIQAQTQAQAKPQATPQATPQAQVIQQTQAQAKMQQTQATPQVQAQAKPQVQATPQATPQVQAQATPQAKVIQQTQAQAKMQQTQATPQVQAQSNTQQAQAKPQVQVQSNTQQAQAKPQVQVNTQQAQVQATPQAQVQATPQAQVQATPQAQAQVQAQSNTQQAQAKPQVQATPQVQSQAKTQVQAQVQAIPQVQAQVQSQAKTQVQAQTQVQANTQQTQATPQVQAQAIPQVQSQAKTQVQAQAQSQAKTQVQAQATPQSNTQQAQAKTQVQATPQVQAQVTPQVQVQAKTQQTQAKTQVQAQATPQVQVQAKTQQTQAQAQSKMQQAQQAQQPQAIPQAQSQSKMQQAQSTPQLQPKMQQSQAQSQSQVTSQSQAQSQSQSQSQSKMQQSTPQLQSQSQSRMQQLQEPQVMPQIQDNMKDQQIQIAPIPFTKTPKIQEIVYEVPKKIMNFLQMRNFIRDNYIQYTWPKVSLENLCTSNGGASIVNFTPTQDLIRHIFTPASAYKGMLLWHSVGTGKCHAINTPILMYDGSIKMVQNIEVGDVIMGDDSKPRNVLSLGQGKDQMYRIEQPFGDNYTVNSEHILCLKDSEDNNKIIEIEVKDYLKLDIQYQSRLKGYKVPVEFNNASIVFDAYDIGYEINNKNIPHEYKYNTKIIRLDLLAGIIDKLATYNNDYYSIESNNQYSKDIIFIARSLGFNAQIKNSIIIITGQGIEKIPVRNPYLQANICNIDVLNYPIQIIPVEYNNYYGFTLDGNNRYLIGDCTVTHNTCCAIATATSSFEKAGYTILWVTRTTLKSDIWKNMFDQVCSIVIQERIKSGQNIPPDFSKRMRLLSKSWKIKPISYKQFSNLVSGKNKLYKELVAINGVEDPLKKTLLIIDEAHKLYGGSDLSAIERPNMPKLHAAIMNSYNKSGTDSAKVLLMTATPITNDAMELLKLLNLCREEQLPTKYDTFAEKYLNDFGKFTKKGMRTYLDDIAGNISYLSRERDARQFAQPNILQLMSPLSKNEYGADILEALKIENENKIATINQEIAYLKTKSSDVKQERIRMKKELRSRCIGLKAAARTNCIANIETDMNYIDSRFEDELINYSNDINKLTSNNKDLKKEIQMKIKLSKEDLSQQAVIENKCNKQKRKQK